MAGHCNRRRWQGLSGHGLQGNPADKEQLVKQAPEGAYVDEAGESLQGFWRAQSYWSNGKAKDGPAVKEVWLDISGNKLRLKIHGAEDECTYKTDPKQSPQHLNIFPSDATRKVKVERKVVLAIYEFTGDELKICFADTDKRPKEFSADEKSGQTLIVLKREKR